MSVITWSKGALGLLGMASFLTGALALAEEAREDYVTRVELSLDATGAGPWYRVELPMALHFAAQHADLRDLRVFNAEGQAQAYALTQAPAPENRQQTTAKWFPLYSQADALPDLSGIRVQRGMAGTVIEVTPQGERAAVGEVLRGWLLDTGLTDASLQRLILDWDAERAGFQRFSIEASDDLQHWRSWGDGQVARLAFADERIEQREVELPGRRARYLRLLWQSPQQAPTLSAATLVSSTDGQEPAAMSWSVPLPGQRLKAGEYRWQLPLALALQRVQIELPQANTLAPVTLSGRREGDSRWQPLARGLLYDLPENGQQVRHDTLELPGIAVQQLTLQVDERGGGLGTDVPLLKIGLPATQLVFLARGTPPYTLAIGNRSAQAANLPLATLIPGYAETRVAQLPLATPAALAAPSVGPTVAQASTFDWKRIALWAVLLAGVGLLALMAISLLRNPPSPGS